MTLRYNQIIVRSCYSYSSLSRILPWTSTSTFRNSASRAEESVVFICTLVYTYSNPHFQNRERGLRERRFSCKGLSFSPTRSSHLAHSSSSTGATYLQHRGHFASFGGRTQAVPFPPGTSNLAEKLHSPSRQSLHLASSKSLPPAISKVTDETTNMASRSSVYFSNMALACPGSVSTMEDSRDDLTSFWSRASSCARFIAMLAFKSQGICSSTSV
jgi:hypothetical protein